MKQRQLGQIWTSDNEFVKEKKRECLYVWMCMQ